MLDNALTPKAIEIRRQLKAVIEDHLPGDFSNWEDDRSRWVGKVKTVMATEKDPRSTTGAFRIYVAYELGEEIFGFANRKRDEEALKKAQEGLALIESALDQMSLFTRREIGRTSYEEISEIVGAPLDVSLPPLLRALRTGTTAARDLVAEKGTPPSKQKRRAAAVIDACREIYSARTGRPAPRWPSKAEYEPSWDKEKPGNRKKFLRFVNAVFKTLRITVRADSAGRVWRELDEASQMQRH